jgi:nucleoside-diphosphate-sugar epimerase
MRIAVTGAGGYVGAHLVRRLAAAGHEVVPFTRARGFRLGEPLPGDALAGLDALVHAAYDFGARGWPEIERVNVRGSIAVFDAALAAGVRRRIFVSSMAAYDGCRSQFGRGKLRVEGEVLARGGSVVRPGTIHGGEVGGMFRSLEGLVAKLPLVPLPDGGGQVLYLTHIDDLADLIERMIDADLPEGQRLITAARPRGETLGGILRGIARGQARRRLFLPVPAGLLLLGLRIGDLVLGSRMPVRGDSLVSLLNPNPAPDFTMPPALEGQTPQPQESRPGIGARSG